MKLLTSEIFLECQKKKINEQKNTSQETVYQHGTHAKLTLVN